MDKYICDVCGSEQEHIIHLNHQKTIFSIGRLEVKWKKDRTGYCQDCALEEVR